MKQNLQIGRYHLQHNVVFSGFHVQLSGFVIEGVLLNGVLPLQAAPRLGLIAVGSGTRVGSECSALLRSDDPAVLECGSRNGI